MTNKHSRRQYQREWRRKNIEKVRRQGRDRMRRWRIKHPEKGKQYSEQHKVETAERGRRWRKNNKERVNRYRRDHYRKFPEKDLFRTKRRRDRMRNAGGTHTLQEWEMLKKEYDYYCPACGKCEPKIKLTEDHIIPISKGGSDNIKNIQPLCGSCNIKKFNKIIKYKCRDLKTNK